MEAGGDQPGVEGRPTLEYNSCYYRRFRYGFLAVSSKSPTAYNKFRYFPPLVAVRERSLRRSTFFHFGLCLYECPRLDRYRLTCSSPKGLSEKEAFQGWLWYMKSGVPLSTFILIAHWSGPTYCPLSDRPSKPNSDYSDVSLPTANAFPRGSAPGRPPSRA